MIDITTPKYDKCRKWIDEARTEKMEWNEIAYGGRSNSEDLKQFLEIQKAMNFWPSELNTELWKEIVDLKHKAEQEALEVEARSGSSILVEDDTELDVYVPGEEKSSWQLYKKGLLDAGWKESAVSEIEKSTLATLKKLNRDTSNSEPVKGLVIGHVQSGKTANMAALMAMAADWKWNFFIVLSGTIENLRKQTQNRLMNDLNKLGNLVWEGGLEHLSTRSPAGRRVQDLRLEDDSVMRYFTVCLKNSTRLKNLIEWAQRDPNKYKQLKIIVIDDEADQASVNTADVSSAERARINKLIVNLVEGRKHDGSPFPVKAKAMNYISYTATPYANFLNESTPESLYPKDFIRTLGTSNEYFGPQQIFGIEGTEYSDGLDILRMIDKDELEDIYAIHRGEGYDAPESLKDAVSWFFCAAAAMRVYHYKKPVSMLIHTSQKQQHHMEIYNSITSWLNGNSSNKEAILLRCEKLWALEKETFTLEALRAGYPDYGRKDEDIPGYPEFTEISPHIETLINEVSHIPLDEDSGADLKYHKGTHICIDNCANNGINDEGMHVRLAYPEPPYNEPAPAFIVIGGSTLSRGLTIEGLVSTYFLRASCQADALMQMGRWFGYRKGYELLPRIWMSADTIEKFRFLAELEYDLRDDLVQYMYAGTKPSEFGPRILNTPKISWMRITAKNKMQGAVPAEMDFTGAGSQTVTFKNDKEILQRNLEVTESFIKSLGDGSISPLKNSLVWRNVDFNHIYQDLFMPFSFHSRSKVFNDMDSFAQWMNKVTAEREMEKWNVVVSGLGKIETNEEGWELPSGVIGPVNRSKKKNQTGEPDLINIGVLRAPSDLYADISDADFIKEHQLNSGKSQKAADVHRIRAEAGLNKTPQLLIYRINKDSKARESEREKKGASREDLQAECDIIGIAMLVPGIRKDKNLVKKITVKIEHMPEEQKDELREE